jgi:Zn-dependent peptidase ImmA (M78 family)
LDINEFRAFTLYDEYAPLIFLNGQDSKAGRIFSIIHEYCHLLINADDDIITSQKAEIESCCNKVAANFLMPGDLVLNLWNSENDIKEEIKTLADKFKVSQLAMAKRLYDYKKITYEAYKKIYDTSVKNFNISKNKKGDHGGNYYFTKKSNLSTEFVKAVLTSTKEGKTLYTDAYRLLNISKPKTFAEFSKGY